MKTTELNQQILNIGNTASDLIKSVPDYKTLKYCSTSEARKLLSFEQACHYAVLPLQIDHNNNQLLLAANKLTPEQSKELQFLLGHDLEVWQVPSEIIERAIIASYKGHSDHLLKFENELAENLISNKLLATKNEKSNSPQSLAARFIQALLDYAIGIEASDLHIIPQIACSRVQLRIKGEIIANQKAAIDQQLHSEIINRLKVMANLNIAQKLIPLDGAFNYQFGKVRINIRMSTIPTIHGESAAIRILGNQTALSFQEIGLASEVKKFTSQFCDLNEGAIILSGPTGSGKTSTLYALANQLAQTNLNVITVEDPVECQIEHLAQININNTVGLNFAMALKAVLRQDPDVIMLGEIRDTESAQIAMQAAQTGHRLLSSVHASNCFEVLTRLRDLKIDLLSIAQAVKLIISQRLVPTLCETCAVFNLQASNESNFEIYQAVGCAQCDYSGYTGRSLVCEALWIDENLQKIIILGKLTYAQLINEITRSNYYSRSQDLLKLLQSRKISTKDYQYWL